MLKVGFTLRNPLLGEHFEILQMPETENGNTLVMEISMSKNGVNPVEHIHETVDEHFEIISGKMSYTYGDEKGMLLPGQTLKMDRNIRHRHWNEQEEMLVVRQTVSPAKDFAEVVAMLFQMTIDGKMKNGNPPLLQAMVLMNYGIDKTYLAEIPVSVQKGMARVLGPIGKALGLPLAYRSMMKV